MVSDELWSEAHARLAATRDHYIRTTGGRLDGRPEIESRWLLTGLSRCGECGGPITVKRLSARGTDYFYYRCERRLNRGATAMCEHGVSIRMEEADRAVLDLLRDEILDPTVIEQALDLAVTEHAADPEQIERDRSQVQADLDKVAAEITRGLSLVLKGLASEEEIGATLRGAQDGEWC